MKQQCFGRWKTTASMATALVALTGSLAWGQRPAAPLVFTHMPVTNAVAELDKHFGIDIVLKGDLAKDPNYPITFTVDDPVGLGARLQALNSLSNALNADFQKVYVVSKLAADDPVPPTRVDTNATVTFPADTMPAADAIQLVAAVDDASVQVSNGVTGNVTFSARTLSAARAASEIARQTHSQWKAFYAVTSRNQAASRGGQSGLASTFSYNRAAMVTPEQIQAATIPAQTAANPPANASAMPLTPAQQQALAMQQAIGGYPAYSTVAPGVATTTAPYYTYQTGPVYNGYGYPYQNTVGGFNNGGYSTGNGGVTVLPSSPFFGNYGAPIILGGTPGVTSF